MPYPLAAAVLPAAAAGAFAQRVSGLGFSLIVAPTLALAAGPRDGVALTNLLSMVVALGVFASSARNLDVAKSAILIPAGLIGVIPGSIVFDLLPAGPLQVIVGVLTGLGPVGGLTAGHLLEHRINATHTRRAAIAVAALATAAAVVRGILT
jgi:uncharacterized protein